MRPPVLPQRDDGFALVEVMISAALLAACGIMMMGVYTQFSDRSEAEMRRTSMLLAFDTLATELAVYGTAELNRPPMKSDSASFNVSATAVPNGDLPKGLQMLELRINADGVTETLPILVNTNSSPASNE